MNPKLLKISISPDQSFSSRFDSVPYFYNEWHVHPEIELVYINKGTGTQFIGNNINHFNEGDMVMVGSNLPHLWKCDDIYFEKGSLLRAESYVVHFMPNVFGDQFMLMPENKTLLELLEKAKKGIKITGETKIKVQGYIKALMATKGSGRSLLLIQILHELSLSTEIETITNSVINNQLSAKESERMNSIFQYLIDNFTGIVLLEDIAKQAHLSPNAFCRYFKTRTKKTFSQFLLEMRINHACKLLADSDKSIGNICFDCGFNNSSHFNRYFKQLHGVTPLEYRKKQMTKLSDEG